MKKVLWILISCLLVGGIVWIATYRKTWFIPDVVGEPIQVTTLDDTLTLALDSTYIVDLQTTRIIVVNPAKWRRLVDYTRANTWLFDAVRNAGGRITVVILPQSAKMPRYASFHPLNYLTIYYPLREATAIYFPEEASRMIIPERRGE